MVYSALWETYRTTNVQDVRHQRPGVFRLYKGVYEILIPKIIKIIWIINLSNETDKQFSVYLVISHISLFSRHYAESFSFNISWPAIISIYDFKKIVFVCIFVTASTENGWP